MDENDELDLVIWSLVEIRDTRRRTGKVHKYGIELASRQLHEIAAHYLIEPQVVAA